MGLRCVDHTVKFLGAQGRVMMQVLFHTREEVLSRLSRLTENLLILPHTLRHLLLDVLLTSDRPRKALSLHSSHGGSALGSHTSVADGFADARRGSSDLAHMPGHSVVLPEHLLNCPKPASNAVCISRPRSRCP